MERFYRFAGVELAVSAPDDCMYAREGTLESFLVDSVTDPHNYNFVLAGELTPPEGNLITAMNDFAVYENGETRLRYIGAVGGDWHRAYIRVAHSGKDHAVELKTDMYRDGMSAKTVLNVAEVEHLIARSGGFVFHSSYIRVGDKGILFTAPSGTGKSTQAELWRKHRHAKVINGDRSAIRCTPDGIIVCGIPFAGSSQICKNVTLPLSAIVYLGQESQTSIRTLRGAEAFRHVWEGITVNIWDKTDISNVMDAVGQVVMQVPVFYLGCTPDESAVIALENALNIQEKL